MPAKAIDLEISRLHFMPLMSPGAQDWDIKTPEPEAQCFISVHCRIYWKHSTYRVFPEVESEAVKGPQLLKLFNKVDRKATSGSFN